MKYISIILIAFLCFPTVFFGQEMKGVAMLSKEQMLDVDAYHVFRTNKYLDFKDMVEINKFIDGTLYQATDLRKKYGSTDWNKIENENASTYQVKNNPGIKYEFSNGNMTAKYTYDDSMINLHGEVKTVYNAKGFVLLLEKKRMFAADGRTETESVINEFDSSNRVKKIINRFENDKDKSKNKEAVINVDYKEHEILICSNNGTMKCELIPSKEPGLFYSDLSARETASQFGYILGNNAPENARKYCTGKALDKLSMPVLKKQVNSISFVSGTGRISSEKESEIEDQWKIHYADGSEASMSVKFSLIQTENGWRISDFILPE
ncbi:hypothetical protein ACTJJ0_02725 [Chitinophaga sp. 22321]|uniref:DUF3828 domain-containing protein n=1 Tax=Chitinophaga hostae TaxID=2831022 RepID=A0ABS5IUE8_9BACT|nr:hypothetical protein [Chitinophaga hostae]MBS0026535.1 hypothetical protein [Chitinophaga hostae]